MNKRKEIERLKGDIQILQVIVKAYQRENERLKKDIETLNASLDAEHAQKVRWENLAHKIDRLRTESVLRMRRQTDALCDRLSKVGKISVGEGKGI